MNNFETPFIYLSIKLITHNKQPDFFPILHLQEGRCLFLKRLYKLFEYNPICNEIKLHFDQIIMLFNVCDNNDNFSSVLSYIALIKKELELCNKQLHKMNQFFSFSCTMTIDYGLAKKLHVHQQGKFPNFSTWSGMHIDRVSTISNIIANDNYPSILITHAFYKHLSLKQQQSYTTLYYIHHICCYEHKYNVRNS